MPKFIQQGKTEAEMFPYSGADAECEDCRAVFQLEVGDAWWRDRQIVNGDEIDIAACECPNPDCSNRRVIIIPPDAAIWAKQTWNSSRPSPDRSYAEALAEATDEDGDLPDTELPSLASAYADPDEPDEATVEQARANAIAARANAAAGRGMEVEGTYISYEDRLANQQKMADKARANKGTKRREVDPISGKFGTERAFGSTDVGGVSERRQPGVGRPLPGRE